jgi:hypothetical protein
MFLVLRLTAFTRAGCALRTYQLVLRWRMTRTVSWCCINSDCGHKCRASPGWEFARGDFSVTADRGGRGPATSHLFLVRYRAFPPIAAAQPSGQPASYVRHRLRFLRPSTCASRRSRRCPRHDPSESFLPLRLPSLSCPDDWVCLRNPPPSSAVDDRSILDLAPESRHDPRDCVQPS